MTSPSSFLWIAAVSSRLFSVSELWHFNRRLIYLFENYLKIFASTETLNKKQCWYDPCPDLRTTQESPSLDLSLEYQHHHGKEHHHGGQQHRGHQYQLGGQGLQIDGQHHLVRPVPATSLAGVLTGDRPFLFINIFLQAFRPSLPIAINSKTEETSSTTSLLSWIWGILGWNKPWIHIFLNSTLLKLNQPCRQKLYTCLGDQSDS